jgi:hypothetical protein|tara:strand:- start:552 stop:671 length:120 start_codon:yes stop_codon:yes gene_type:complete
MKNDHQTGYIDHDDGTIIDTKLKLPHSLLQGASILTRGK